MPTDLLPAAPDEAQPEAAVDLSAIRAKVAAEEAPVDLAAIRKKVEEDDRAEDDHLSALFGASLTKEPDNHAAVLQIVRDTNAPADVVEARLPEFRRAWEASKFNPTEFRKEFPELAELVKRRPDLMPVVKDVPFFLRLFRGIRAQADALGPEAGTQSLDARVQTPRQLAADAAFSGEMAKKTETVDVLQDASAKEAQGLEGLERVKVLATAYSNAAKQQEYSKLGSQALFAYLGGGEPWEYEKRAAELERDLVPRDYGSGPVEQLLVDTAEILPSQVEVIKSSGKVGAIGAGVGALVGGLASRSLVGVKEGAKLGANIGARIGATAASFEMEAGSSYLDFKKMRTDKGEPLTQDEAAGAALIYGAAAAGIEGLSFGATEEQAKVAVHALLANPEFRALARKATKTWLHKAADEGLEEGLQTIAQDVVGYLAKSKHEGELQRADPISTVAQATSDALKAFTATAVTGAPGVGLSLGTAAVRRASSSRAGQQVAAITKMADTPAAKAAPAEIAKLIEAETTKNGGQPVRSLFIEPTEFLRLFQGSRPEAEAAAKELMGEEGPQRLKQAITSGQRLEVPVAEYLEKWGTKPIAQALAPHTTTTPLGETQAQAQVLEKAAQKLAEEFKKAGVDEKQVELASAGEGDFAQKLETQLAAIHEPEEARKLVQPIRAFIRTMATRFDVPAEKLFARYLLSVQEEGKQAQLSSLVDPQAPAASVALQERLKTLTPEQRAAEYYLDPVTGLRNERAFDAEPVPEGKQVAVITSPTVKAINDDEAGGHDKADAMLRTWAKVLADAGHPEAARSGTNLLIHVGSGEEIQGLLQQLRAATPEQRIAIRANLGATRQEAGEALGTAVKAERAPEPGEVRPAELGEPTLPRRKATAKELGLDVGALSFPEGKATGQVQPHLVERIRGLSDEAYFQEAYVDPQTGLLNALGWENVPRKEHVAAFDLKGLKAINDRFGKEAGDIYLRAFGMLARDLLGSDFDFAHLHGDEYAAQHSDRAALEGFVDLLNEHAQNTYILFESPTEVLERPLGFRHGIGERTYESADRDLNARKRAEGEAASPTDGGGVRSETGSGGVQGSEAALDRDARRDDLARRREALRRRARPQGFPGSRGTAFQEGLIQDLRPQGLRDAQAFVDRMKKSERKDQAQRWFNYAVGIIRRRPTDVPDKLKSELAAFGVVDPEGFEVTQRMTGQKSDAKAFRRTGKSFGAQPDSLKEYRLRSMGADGVTLGQPGYHGSPHRFEGRFSLQKIGSGEGVQAYGWGLYFAQERDVAEAYRRRLESKPSASYGGKPVEMGLRLNDSAYSTRDRLLSYLAKDLLAHKGPTLEQSLHQLQLRAENPEAAAAENLDPQEIAAFLKDFDPKALETNKGGQVYRVDLPEHDELLDYDKPLRDQSPKVLQALEKVIPGLNHAIDLGRQIDAITEKRSSEFQPEDRARHDALSKEWRDAIRNLRMPNGETVELRPSWSVTRGHDVYTALSEANAGSPKAASEALRAIGIPGLRYLDLGSRADDEGTSNFVIWDESRISEPTTFYQPPGEGEGDGTTRGYTEFVRRGVERIARVVLQPGADMSTFLHESAHIFLDMYEELAARPDAPVQVKEDLAAIRTWMGLKDGEAIEETHHEKWARTFEAYLMEGKAPSSSLRRAFTRFRLWLTSIYKNLSQLNPDLSPEIRGVFDRMLATDEELAKAEQRMGLSEPLWNTPEQAGMTPQDFAAYLKSKEDAVSNAQRKAELAALKDRQRETERWWKDEEKAIRDALGDEYEALPERKATLLMHGKLESIPSAPILLDRKAVVEAVGEDGAKKLLTTKKGGADPQDLADAIGEKDGPALLKAMVALPEKAAWAKATAAERMRAKYPSILEERDQLRELVEKALHNEFTADTLYQEIQALEAKAGALWEYREERLGTPPPPMKSYERAAEKIVEDTEAGKLAAGRALQAERAAADRALKHAAAGEYAMAAVAKRQQLLNMFLYRTLHDAVEEREQFLHLAADLRKDKARARLGKANTAFRDGVDAILEAVGLRPVDPNAGARAGLDAVVTAMEGSGTTVMFDVNALTNRLGQPRAWKQLKMSELRNVLAALQNIRKAGSSLTTAKVDGKNVDQEQVIAEMAVEAAANRKDLGPLKEDVQQGKLERFSSRLASIDAALTKPETTIDWLGGGDLKSTWHRAIIAPLQEAKQREADLLKTTIKPIVEAFENIPAKVQKRFTEEIDGKTLFPTHRPDLAAPTKRFQLLMMALNSGNESNLQRLLEGRGITPEQLQAALDLLSKEEIAWINAVGRQFESLWPLSKELEERDSGLAPPKVEPKPMVLKNGTIEGFYFPAVYTRKAENVVGELQAARQIADLFNKAYVRPGTPHSHLKNRVENFRGAIALDPSIITAHLAQVTHDIAFREAVKSVGGLILHPDVQGLMKRYLGDERARTFRQWVQDVGTMRGSTVDAHAEGLDRITRQLKSNTALAVLGYATNVAAGDLANLAVGATMIQKKHWAAALWDYIAHPQTGDAIAHELSAEMRFRRDHLQRELSSQLGRLTKDGVLKLKAFTWYKEHAFSFMEWTDRITSVPIWMGAFRQSITEQQAAGGEVNQEDAVRFADSIIRQAFPSHSAVDKAALLRSRGFWGTSTAFYGYLSTIYSRQRDLIEPFIQAEGGRAGAKEFARMSGRLLALWTTYGVLGELLTGRGPEAADGDDPLERWVTWFLRKLVTAPLSTLPIPATQVVESLLLKRQASVRATPMNQIFDGVGKALQEAGKGNNDKAALEAIRTLGILLGLPVRLLTAQGRYFYELLGGELPPQDPGDVARGALYGPPPKG